MLGLLALLILLAIPKFTNSPKITKARHAKLMLQQIFLQEQAYWEQNGTYVGVHGGRLVNRLSPGESDPGLFIRIKSCTPYTYEWRKVSDSTFTVIATGNIDGDPDPDVWILDQSGNIVHSVVD
ncbi:MAG TPA: hypothetical protein EYP53_08580 [Candidatus Latescibacteria bacterium]|nr:hypothetical protein [Candidatus Latescibacterota bacterium]